MLKGTVQAPPSKSVAHRAIIAAALSGGRCRIRNVAMSKDIQATLGCMEALGAKVQFDEKKGEVILDGREDKPLKKTLTMDCCESGSTLRFMIPLALLTGQKVTFTGEGRLMQRPQKPYADLFAKKGISYIQEENCIHVKGMLKAGLFQLPGNVSSQFITGLLFALPLLEGDSEIQLTTILESKGYVDLTLQVLRDFGIQIENKNYRRFIIPGGQSYQACDYIVEADYSQAAFFLVAGALGCDVGISGLKKESLQGDKKILELLQEVGANVEEDADGTIRARRTEEMRGIRIDAGEIPDLVPILAVLCAFCKGESLIYNAGRLRMKESDRLSAVTSELRHLGVQIEEGADYLKIVGAQVISGTTVSSWNDHRIAMALAIAACRAEGEVAIVDAKKAVTKSYPNFFEVYTALQKGPKVLLKANTIITEETV
jgi:3-phosphoshikimate 1-carboxyvinyltransferase